jgi:DNA repair exonuclease SbcCD ATPase subunit|tara:strand:- start:4693 stop:6375 length:1683 start_codon:yes stop_codon:yes gene_type:complete
MTKEPQELIIFQTLKYKNFLSTGNTPITIQLNKSPSTLVVGTNGTGKSTILDALSFALFGKAHRNVNKTGLINSINGKHCEVTVEFKTAGHQFKVVRGIHPQTFEVYQNDKMIDQQTNVRDYQKLFEQNILKLNHKSFHQIVVLGSSSFIPFMQLKSHDRRDVIEDLLDINIFSKMKVILRERSSKARQESKSSKISVDAQKEKIEQHKLHLNQLEKINEEAKQSFDADIANTQEKIDSIKTKVDAFPIGLRGSLNSLRKVREGLNTEKGRHSHSMEELVSTAKFFEVHEDCPKCTQPINPQLKNAMLIEVKQQAKATQDEITLNKLKYDETIKTVEDIQTQISQMADLNTELTTHTSNMASLVNKKVNEVDIVLPAKQLINMAYQLDEMQDTYNDAAQELLYNDVAQEMLKDTGIRTKIIKEYLPAMNTLINKYLQTLEFFCAFHLNENFEETIKSRHRDAFVYDNFSEGEKMRIDLSLLFAWRQIAKMKNSTNTNLLILDETFDSSLDEDGVDNLMKILKTLDKGTNIFIISHKPDMLESKLLDKIVFTKKNNFSAIE